MGLSRLHRRNLGPRFLMGTVGVSVPLLSTSEALSLSDSFGAFIVREVGANVGVLSLDLWG